MSVLVAACALFSAVFKFRGLSNSDNPAIEAAAETKNFTGQTTFDLTGPSKNCDKSYTLNFDNGVYAVRFWGQDGNGSKQGYGAVCLAFYKGNSMTVRIGQGGGNPYSSSYGSRGGGKTTISTNFGRPNGQTDTSAVAGGGGGGGTSEAGSGIGYTNYKLIADATWAGANYSNYGQAMAAKFSGWAISKSMSNGSGSYYWMPGTPASQSSGGFQGPNSYSSTSKTKSPNGSYYYVGVYGGSTMVSGSGGGAGYNDGGGGSAFAYVDGGGSLRNSGPAQGGGGSCSPNCYPLCTSDITGYTRNPYNGNGGVSFYRIDPTTLPEGASKTYDGTALTLKNTGNTGAYVPESVEYVSGIKTAWVYQYTNNNGNTWFGSTMSKGLYGNGIWGQDVPQLTNIGTIGVRARYVMYAASGTDTLGSTYHMKYTSPEAAAGDSEYIIKEVTGLNLTINTNGTAAVSTDPTFMSSYYGSDRYFYREVDSSGTNQDVAFIYDAGTATHGTMQYILYKSDAYWTQGAVEVNWTTDKAAIKAKAPGYYLVKWYAKGDAGYNDSGQGSKSVQILTQAKLKKPKAPTVTATSTPYTGNAIKLLSAAATNDGNPSGSYTIKYKVDSGSWVTDINSVTATNAGTYTVYYYAASTNTTNYIDSDQGYVTVTITKVNGSISKNTLAAVTGLKYNNGDQSLFTGTPTRSGDGTIYYRVIKSTATSAPTASTGSGENSTLSNMKGKDAYTGTTQYRYYLYYRVAAGTNHNAVDWTYSGVYGYIAKGEFTCSGTAATAVTYDGATHCPLTTTTAPTLSATGLTTSMVTTTYSMTQTSSGWSTSYNNQTWDTLKVKPKNAGTYELTVKWTPTSSYTDNIAGGSKSFTFTINKTSVSSKVSVTSLSVASSVNVGTNGVWTAPFASTSKIDLQYSGNSDAGWNGLSSETGTTYNNCYYAFVAENTQPAASATSWVETASTTALINGIKALKPTASGTWTLWLKVKTHYNFATNMIIKAAQITANGYNAATIPLTGVTMTGASTYGANGLIPYDGAAHSVIAAGTLASSHTALTLGTVSYAVGDSATVAPTTGWQTSTSSLPTFTNICTKYLWVKWTASTNVAASDGRMYAKFEIQQFSLDTANCNIYFAGVTFNGGTPERSVEDDIAFDNYNLPFNNGNQRMIAGDSAPTIKAYYKSGSKTTGDLATDFGTFEIGVSEALDAMTGNYYGLTGTNYRNVVAKNGSHYVWIRWSGSDNVKAGAMAYRIYDSSRAVYATPKMNIVSLTSLTDSNFAVTNTFLEETNGGSHQFRYLFEDNTYVPQGQPLFQVKSAVSFTINGSAYSSTGVSSEYLLITSNDKSVATSSNFASQWKSEIGAAQQSDLGSYYMFVRITINDDYVNASYVYMHPTAASITSTTSFVQVAPTPIDGIVFTADNDKHQLITASAQLAPKVEYSLGQLTANASGQWVWTQDVTAESLKWAQAGSFKVYYRGASYTSGGKTIFTTQVKEDTTKALTDINRYNYSYVTVSINKASAMFDPAAMPQAKSGVYYTGSNIPCTQLFTDGKAKLQSSSTEIPLVYSWSGSASGWYDYGANELSIKDAGVKTLFFKAKPGANSSVDDANEIMSIAVTINKVEVEISAPVIANGGVLTYKGGDYQILLQSGNYFLQHNGTRLTVSGANIAYSFYKNGTYLINGVQRHGNFGAISYAVSNSTDVNSLTVESWKSNYQDLKVSRVGTYYIWMKVDAGDNHIAHNPVCFSSSPITITRASASDIRLNQSSYTVQKEANGDDLRFNGLARNLISDLQLSIQILDRDENGNAKISGTDNVYRTIPSGENIGEIFYAITDVSETAPAITDRTATGWRSMWQNLSRVHYGNYKLWVMLYVSDTNTESNISTVVECLSTLAVDGDAPVRQAISIGKAIKSDLSVSGLYGMTEMFTGANIMVKDQKLVGGNLSVRITGSNYNLSDEINNAANTYVLWNVTEHGSAQPTASQYTVWADTGAVGIGQYQLYFKIAIKDGVNDIAVDDLIFELFSNNTYAQIIPTNELSMKINVPSLNRNLAYDGTEQCLIAGAASLEMKNGNNSFIVPANNTQPKFGQASYYISGSPETLTKTGTFDNTGAGEDGWYTDITVNGKLKQANTGTYYIWIKFGAGYSHTEIEPRYIGSVTIGQAAENDIVLSGITFVPRLSYDGSEKQLISTGVTQRFKTSGILLSNINDYSKIEYAYSNDPLVAPVASVSAWLENINDLKASNAGQYYIWVKVTSIVNPATGARNIADYYKCYCIDPERDFTEIAAADLEYSYFNNSITPRTEGLRYIGQDQQQILATVTLNSEAKLPIVINGNDVNTTAYNNNIDVKWGLGDSATLAGKPITWYEDINELKGTNAGNYYLWVWVKTNGDNENLNEYLKCFAVVNIAPAQIILTAPSYYGDDSDGLIYNGESQNLLKGVASAKFLATGIYYGAGQYYDVDDDLQIKYSVNTVLKTSDSADIQALTGVNAGNYTVNYGVFAGENWNQSVGSVIVSIAQCNAALGLNEVPYALDSVVYTDYYDSVAKERKGSVQNLIAYGSLTSLALHHCAIEFWYEGETQHYRYYYDAVKGGYTWLNDAELPGRINAANDYKINYQVIALDASGNYCNSAVEYLNAQINPRPIRWETKPEAISGLKYSGKPQRALEEGRLNVNADALGVTIYYSKVAPGVDAEHRLWNQAVPEVDSIGLWDIYYYVELDSNNVFVGDAADENDPLKGTLVQVLVERYILNIRTAPESSSIMYTAVSQNLITYSSLSVETRKFAIKEYFIGKSIEDNSVVITDQMATEIQNYLLGNNYIDEITFKLSSAYFAALENGTLEVLPALLVNHADSIYELIDNTLNTQNVYGAQFSNLDLPYFEYRFNPDAQITQERGLSTRWQQGNITAMNQGEYVIDCRLVYKKSIFTLAGYLPSGYELKTFDDRAEYGNLPYGTLTARIQAMSFPVDSVRAVIKKKTNGEITANDEIVSGGTFTREQAKNLYLDFECNFQNELLNDGNVRYYYRVYDEYNKHEDFDRQWTPDTEFNLGTYQFMVSVLRDEENKNFEEYNQTRAFSQITIAEDRAVLIEMPLGTYSDVAYVRAWIDFTGEMAYEDSPFKYQHEVNTMNSLFHVFENVNSVGKDGRAVVRIKTINNENYFRTWNDYYKKEINRKTNSVDMAEDEQYYLGKNNEYIGLSVPEIKFYLYQVYAIQYDKNGAEPLSEGVAPQQGWKWHGIPYKLDENIYKKKSEDGSLLNPNGWTITRAGDGKIYPKGSHYEGNVSQIFYANFFNAEDEKYKIEWIITAGNTTYQLSSTGKWFKVEENDSRDTGIFVAEGEIIPLPQIITDEDGNKFWSGLLFGGYHILGWKDEDGAIYNVDTMHATRDVTYTASVDNEMLVYNAKTVRYVFTNEKDEVINDSGDFASGASACMSLSGMSLEKIKAYYEGYDEWIKKYGNEQIKTKENEDSSYYEHNLGAAAVVEKPGKEETEEEGREGMDEYFVMFIIIAAGVITLGVTLAIYKVMCRRKKGVKIKRFKEERAKG